MKFLIIAVGVLFCLQSCCYKSIALMEIRYMAYTCTVLALLMIRFISTLLSHAQILVKNPAIALQYRCTAI